MNRGVLTRMDITIQDHQKKVRLNSPQILKVIRAILRHEHVNGAILSVVFVSHQRIKALNKKYLISFLVPFPLKFVHLLCTSSVENELQYYEQNPKAIT